VLLLLLSMVLGLCGAQLDPCVGVHAHLQLERTVIAPSDLHKIHAHCRPHC
jgi:hypothetical protein